MESPSVAPQVLYTGLDNEIEVRLTHPKQVTDPVPETFTVTGLLVSIKPRYVLGVVAPIAFARDAAEPQIWRAVMPGAQTLPINEDGYLPYVVRCQKGLAYLELQVGEKDAGDEWELVKLIEVKLEIARTPTP